jgi:hypothetical protein
MEFHHYPESGHRVAEARISMEIRVLSANRRLIRGGEE